MFNLHEAHSTEFSWIGGQISEVVQKTISEKIIQFVKIKLEGLKEDKFVTKSISSGKDQREKQIYGP